MLMSSICQCLPCLLHAPLRERRQLTLAEACTYFYSGCNTTACRDAVVQPYKFDPESDPDVETPEEVQTLWLQQNVSEWLVCLNMLLSLFVCDVTFTTM